MGIYEVLREKREEILQIAARHGAYNVRVFGSVARGEEGPDSDVDVLVSLEKGRTLLDHAALLLELRELIGGEVDVLTEAGLKPRYRETVLREAVNL